MSAMYKLMIYFAVATLHLYRDDIIPPKEGEEFSIILKKNKTVLTRVCEEAENLFRYELSQEQMRRAVIAYLTKSQSVKDSEAAKLRQA